eukprot:c28173_g1_i1 orf=226-2568(-)
MGFGCWGYLGALLITLITLRIPLPAVSASSAESFLIGVGSYDITGPAADANMMGYANSSQNAAGIHFRLRARTFIVAEPGKNGKRVLFANLDACMASQIVTIEVLARLKERYGDLYNENNVAISGTHTHSGPGGYLQYVLYIVTSLGFIHQSFNALVDGIENSIIQAHENLRPGSIFINSGELFNASTNRSPSAYLNNPAEERARYQSNTDKEMTLLKFIDAERGPIGAFSWFAVHGTSMNGSNLLISGDNKGAAARFMEDWYNGKPSTDSIVLDPHVSQHDDATSKSHELTSFSKSAGDKVHIHSNVLLSTGVKVSTLLSNAMQRVRSRWNTLKAPFVAAFCQSNVGDTSPNILGAFCLDTGLPCDFNHSTCNGRNELCMGRGPAYPDDFMSTKIIGERQFMKAIDLFNSATENLVGNLDFRHKYVDFSNLEVSLPPTSPGRAGEIVTTCPAAVGFSFAAGTTDGPGAFNFKQGDDQGNAFWRLVGALLKPPTDHQIQCQKPKPILIDTGEMFEPYAWAPAILPIQILKIGHLFILCVPAEFTTMAGRRLKEAVKTTLINNSNGEFGDDIHIVIAGLTNAYSQYVTTFEEYQIQRYEGASTLYGPHTLSAYIQEFSKLAVAIAQDTSVEAGPSPPNLLSKQIQLLPGVVVDATPVGIKFGDLFKDVPSNDAYKSGDVVTVTFWTACPRNDLFTEKTFSLVEICDANGTCIPVYDDDDFCLRFIWSRPSRLSPFSHATIVWEIPDAVNPGNYRIRHFGAAKHLLGSIQHFNGTSSTFVVM